MGRATIDSSRLAARWQNFNPRPPWGGRLNPDIASNGYYNFNPRPPWGGRRSVFSALRLLKSISIHALRGEGDNYSYLLLSIFFNISIHALRGEGDHICLINKNKIQKFQSTPSVGRATLLGLRLQKAYSISIHALRGEGDMPFVPSFPCLVTNFNPRPPWGGRRYITF